MSPEQRFAVRRTLPSLRSPPSVAALGPGLSAASGQFLLAADTKQLLSATNPQLSDCRDECGYDPHKESKSRHNLCQSTAPYQLHYQEGGEQDVIGDRQLDLVGA